MESQHRPSRAQRTLLTFIAQFIGQYGYGPSYREIMAGMDYKSVSTVAAHVNALVIKGCLRKRGRTSRSLEVVPQPKQASVLDKTSKHEDWLVARLEAYAALPTADKALLVSAALLFKAMQLDQAHTKAADLSK